MATVWMTDDESVWFASFSGGDFEVQPTLIERYDSNNEVFAQGISIDEADRGRVALAVSYCDVGGCGLELARLNGPSVEGAVSRLDADASEIVSVTSNGDGAGVAWVERARDAANNTAIGVGHVGQFGDRGATVIIDNARRTQRQPAIAWNEQGYGLAYVDAPDPESAGRLMFRTVSTELAAGAPRQLSDAAVGTAYPTVRWLPGNRRFAVTWHETSGRNRLIKVALLDAEGGLTDGPFAADTVSGTRPSLIPLNSPQEVDALGVVWIEGGVEAVLGWLVRDARGWTLRPPVDIAGPVSAMPWALGAWGFDAPGGVLYTVDEQRDALNMRNGDFGCPTGP